MLLRRCDREWAPEQRVLPHVTFLSDESVRIDNVRDFSYHADGSSDARYASVEYDLSKARSVQFVSVPFWSLPVSHVFLIFDFDDDRSLAVSVEARRRQGEEFTWRCLIPHYYGLIYVCATPEDVITARTIGYHADVYRYDLSLNEQTAGRVLKSMLQSAARLESRPRFYHPFVHSCSMDMVRHLRRAGARLPRFDWRYVLPRSLDGLFVERGLIDWKGSMEDLRTQALIPAQ